MGSSKPFHTNFDEWLASNFFRGLVAQRLDQIEYFSASHLATRKYLCPSKWVKGSSPDFLWRNKNDFPFLIIAAVVTKCIGIAIVI